MDSIFYEEIGAGESLSDFVKRFWRYSNRSPYTQYYTILPDGYFDLIIKIAGTKIDGIFLFGLCTREMEVIIPEDTVIVGICFKPLAAEFIFHKSIAGILNSFNTFEKEFLDINGCQFDNFKKWATGMASQMLLKVNGAKSSDDRKQIFFELLFKYNGFLKVEELAKKTFWNSRQINRYFRKILGLTLKEYLNILRCASSYTDIQRGDLFPKQGFCDQAHFIKEIKKHTGSTPKNLYKNKNDRFLQFSTLRKF